MAENQGKSLSAQGFGGTKSDVARREEETLAWWKERGIFKKTLAKPAPKGEFVFYEGPPTANGLPGIHHLESRAFKDAIPRYRTMRGYHVRRKAGWDTHGIPVELEVEKKLSFKSKKDIEAYGVAKFNAKCKESVLQYIDEWKRFTDRIAFWVDHEDTYFTFDNDYIESVWNVLKQAHERKLLYKDYKVVPWCPRCGTALSSHEVAQGYEDNVPDPSVYVKFKVKNPEKIGLSGDVYLLAWTTTPWTLLGNVALAISKKTLYRSVKYEDAYLLVAVERLTDIGLIAPDTSNQFSGTDLIGLEYEPLFPYLARALPNAQSDALKNAYKVYAADFVSTEDGTGIVHTAVMYGADDFELGTKVGLPKYHLVGEDGKFLPATGELAGKFVKDADAEIIATLEERGALFRKETIKHTYPFCWRCKTPLLYYARDSWYIAMSRIKDDLIRENAGIHWEPEHIREGRFGEWLRELKDWAISRSRYWGTPLPFWECEKCKHVDVIGSFAELKEKTGTVPADVHRPYIDELTYSCERCGLSRRSSDEPSESRLRQGYGGAKADGVMKRVPEVLDVWFDSGAMPFAQDHYPFDSPQQDSGQVAEGKPFVKKDLNYPADYICEAIDQTRGWFYTLHAVGGIMGRGKAFKHVICLGHILDAKGKKMSKSLGNIVEPNAMLAKYGADALRYFMYTVNAPGDSKNFDERIVDEIVKKHIGRLTNVLAFYQLYADTSTPFDNAQDKSLSTGETVRDWKSSHILDRWILARLDELIRIVTAGFETYRLDAATRPIGDFIDDLSTWYVRRSRERFKAEGKDPSTPFGKAQDKSQRAGKKAALATLRYVLHALSRLIAPSTPFLAEHLFQAVREEEDEESVHLAAWPEASATVNFLTRLLGWGNEKSQVLSAMSFARDFVNQALQERDKAGIRVRQPLLKLTIPRDAGLAKDFFDVIAAEINVKEIVLGEDFALDTTITDELREEGIVRDTIRLVQDARKAKRMKPGERGKVTITIPDAHRSVVERHLENIKLQTKTEIDFFSN